MYSDSEVGCENFAGLAEGKTRGNFGVLGHQSWVKDKSDEDRPSGGGGGLLTSRYGRQPRNFRDMRTTLYLLKGQRMT